VFIMLLTATETRTLTTAAQFDAEYLANYGPQIVADVRGIDFEAAEKLAGILEDIADAEDVEVDADRFDTVLFGLSRQGVTEAARFRTTWQRDRREATGE